MKGEYKFRKEGRCCICGGTFTHYGKNPWPLYPAGDKRCCDYCNREIVIPARCLRSDLIERYPLYKTALREGKDIILVAGADGDGRDRFSSLIPIVIPFPLS